ncbi:hypothetical protein TorRG33x02_167770 [Trema orientale]|uniref:Uncharacterized protein n=1 Tax=Trema orientale TaxID=63057 RepID=A0A2P5EPG3_TREOI|nr:hypothetical protein TorRG33x02_167770 [Trema orientale]
MNAKSKLIIAEKDELLPELLNLMSPEKDPNLIEARLSYLIAKPKSWRVKLIAIGAESWRFNYRKCAEAARNGDVGEGRVVGDWW